MIDRLTTVIAKTGYPKSTIYLRISQGLLTHPVSIGPRAVGWPTAEITAVTAARIAGKDEQAIRALVRKLESERNTVQTN